MLLVAQLSGLQGLSLLRLGGMASSTSSHTFNLNFVLNTTGSEERREPVLRRTSTPCDEESETPCPSGPPSKAPGMSGAEHAKMLHMKMRIKELEERVAHLEDQLLGFRISC